MAGPQVTMMGDNRYGIGEAGFHNAAVDTAKRAEAFNQEEQLSRYRAFVDELMEKAKREMIGDWDIKNLLRKHNSESEE